MQQIFKYVNYALSLLTPLQLVTSLQYVQISNKMKLAKFKDIHSTFIPLKLVGLFNNNNNNNTYYYYYYYYYFRHLSQGISHPSFFHHQGC
jgi:hypothetical protein